MYVPLNAALALRRMLIAKMQTPPDEASYQEHLRVFEEKDPQVGEQAEAARKLINSIIDDPSTPSDNAALGHIDDRIDSALDERIRRHLNEENAQLLVQLNAQNFAEVRRILAQG